MNLQAFTHEVKSNLSYMYDEHTLHLRMKTAAGEARKVTVNALDPYDWIEQEDGRYQFNTAGIRKFPMQLEQTTDLFDVWFAELTGFEWQRIRYAFLVDGEQENYFVSAKGVFADYRQYEPDWAMYYNFPYLNYEDVYTAPGWVKDTIWYQIFPERFYRKGEAEGFLPWGKAAEVSGSEDVERKFGGNLDGIAEKLDYIQEMGFTGIYFTPIFQSPSSHKYDTTDYFTIDPDFGDNESLKKLIKEIHKRGMKIMLDAVFNHCGSEHPFWKDVLEKGSMSPYYDYFFVQNAEKPSKRLDHNNQVRFNYKTFGFSECMPKWNTGNEEVRAYLMKVGRYWAEEFEIDGWRLDVSNEVSHDFWRRFRKEIKSVNPNLYILGENWDNSYPWLMGDQMDATMNYEFSSAVLNWLGTERFCQRKIGAEEFKNSISRLLTTYPKHLTRNMFNLLDSHDTPRVLTVCGGEVSTAVLAYAVLFTFPGSPSVYYGGEIGLDGDENNNRKCMVWEEEKQNSILQQQVKHLIKLRREHDSFKSTELSFYLADQNRGLIYRKKEKQEEIYVIINHTETVQTYRLPTGSYQDLIQGNQAGEEIKVEPKGFSIVKHSADTY